MNTDTLTTLQARVAELEAALEARGTYWTADRARTMRSVYWREHRDPPTPLDDRPVASLWVCGDGRCVYAPSPRLAFERALTVALDAWEAEVTADPLRGPESTPHADCDPVHRGSLVTLHGRDLDVFSVLDALGCGPRIPRTRTTN